MEVAVLGGGYAGVALTRRLERNLPAEVDITLVDDTGSHLIQHELHRLIRFPDIEEHVRLPLDNLLSRATVKETTVTSVDPDIPRAETETGPVEPTYLAICLGAVTADYGLPGVREFGQPLKRRTHAAAIRTRYQQLGETDTVAVVGAGLSGVQVAGELAAMTPSDEDGPEILLLEQEDEVAPRFPQHFREAVRAALDDIGVRTITDSIVAAASDEAVELVSGDTIECQQLVWTGGIAGSSSLAGHRPEVRSDLRIAERTFAMGDAARVVDDLGNAAPPSAQTAIRQAHTAASSIVRLAEADLEGGHIFEPRLKRYRYNPRGWVVSVGDDAVAQVGDSVVRGSSARAIKASIWAGYLSSIGRIRDSLEVIAEEVAPGHLR